MSCIKRSKSTCSQLYCMSLNCIMLLCWYIVLNRIFQNSFAKPYFWCDCVNLLFCVSVPFTLYCFLPCEILLLDSVCVYMHGYEAPRECWCHGVGKKRCGRMSALIRPNQSHHSGTHTAHYFWLNVNSHMAKGWWSSSSSLSSFFHSLYSHLNAAAPSGLFSRM